MRVAHLTLVCPYVKPGVKTNLRLVLHPSQMLSGRPSLSRYVAVFILHIRSSIVHAHLYLGVWSGWRQTI